MKVHQIMTWPVRTCGPRDSLERAAQLLLEQDCGALPVVDEKNRVLALLTDHDICMGAYTHGKRLSELTVADSMSPTGATCRPHDDVAVAAQRMATLAMRRLPVVDDDGRIQGIVSLSDLARASERDRGAARAASHVPAASRPAAPSPDEARGAALFGSNTDGER